MILARLNDLFEPTLPPSAYVVHGARGYRRAVVGVVLSLAVLLALAAGVRALGFGDGGWGPAIFLWVMLGGYSLFRTLRRPELLRIDAEAVRFEDVVVPWPSVWQVVILREPFGAQPVQVGLRLKRGAPLPTALDSLVTRAAEPLAIDPGMRSHVTGTAVDDDAVVVAVRAFAPQGVELLERSGDRESVLYP